MKVTVDIVAVTIYFICTMKRKKMRKFQVHRCIRGKRTFCSSSLRRASAAAAACTGNIDESFYRFNCNNVVVSVFATRGMNNTSAEEGLENQKLTESQQLEC